MNGEFIQIDRFAFDQFPAHLFDVAVISRLPEDVDRLDAHVAQVPKQRLRGKRRRWRRRKKKKKKKRAGEKREGGKTCRRGYIYTG